MAPGGTGAGAGADGAAAAGAEGDGSRRRRGLDLAAWGAVGALAFLVLALAYRILTPASPSLVVLLPVAVLVGVAGAVLVALARRRQSR